MEKNFCSDNGSGVCPEVMQALADANQGHVPSYGNDRLTQEADELIKAALGRECDIYYVYNGTAANTLACKSVLRSIDSIICPDSAHIFTHEVGAPANATGSKIITLPAVHGKITPEQIRTAYEQETYWGPHATRPRLVSITQSTEWGTFYSLEELAAIKAVCEETGMLLHVDGCRIYNAVVAMDSSLADLCQHMDILSLGGTKNGLMFGEALVFFNQEAADGFLHLRKQGLQLHSKMRFISAQMKALFTDGLWQKNALQANRMTERLAEGVLKHPDINLYCPVQTNQLFVTMPKVLADKLMAVRAFFPNGPECYRMVTSFDTTEEEVDSFVAAAMEGQ
ncbi:threonine aldolase family protein [Endozoicomonas arenosclerae]|uniref:threonine aldolase family protein n=1 Tax=Endozoicomonas arenosclerae TaxID=1633495 RepID=UPI0007827DC2|nr:beta-eliminating lyase-related protein [Endozoicomonas arenosclerae]